MELFTVGFAVAFSAQNLLYCLFGVFLGNFIGVLPGLGAPTAMALLLSVTFYFDPIPALILLAGIYYGAEYGGSIASILLNVPGTAANAITTVEGYPMAKQGRAGVALLLTAVSSFIGGAIGIILLMLLSPVLVSIVLSFGPSEYFALMVIALIAAGSIGSSSPVKGIAVVMLGLLLGCVGIDLHTGVPRYTFGYYDLFEGISIIILCMGLFGITEIIASVHRVSQATLKEKVSYRSMIPTSEDTRRSVLPSLRGSAIGAFFGTLPGTGPTLAAFVSYLVEKRVSRMPNQFGKGAVEGVVSPEAANNAAVQTAFIPTLTMGIPGTPTMAIVLSAMMIHGITPGPLLLDNHPEVFWGLIASFWVGNLMLLVLNIPMVGIWIRVLKIPYNILYPIIVLLICLGVYSIHNSLFDIALVFLIGAVGYAMRLMDLEPAPLLLGFILGPMVEENFRRALLLSHGNFLVLFERPISGTLLLIAIVTLLWITASVVRSAWGTRNS